MALLRLGEWRIREDPEYTCGVGPIKAIFRLAVLLAPCAWVLSAGGPSLDIGQYAHTAFRIRDGFTRGSITSIAQTPDGYLWLGTEFGLVRFDGARAVPWPASAGAQLPSSFVRGLMVGRDGTLWIATAKGFASWRDGRVTPYPEIGDQTVSSPLQDGEGTVWFGANGPGRLCAIQGGKAVCYGAGTFGNSVNDVYEDRKHNLWVAAQTGLWRWAPGPAEHYTLPGGEVEPRALIEGEGDDLLIITAVRNGRGSNSSIEGLKQLVGGRFRSHATPGSAGQFRPTCLFRGRDGGLWVGTVQGLLHFYQGRIDRFAAADGLSGDVVMNVFGDREGNVWVSTQDGLDRFREVAVPTISFKQGLSNSAVYVLQATPDGSIWIATADGLNRWANGRVFVYGKANAAQRIGPRDPGGTIGPAVTEVANSGLPSTARSLGQDNLGRLWASTEEGVYRFEAGRFTRIPGIPGGNIFLIAGDDHGKIWISNADAGLFSWTPDGAVQEIPWARFGKNSGAVALLPDPVQSGLWLGFYDGGIAYLKDGQVRASYKAPDGLGRGSVSSLQFGSDGAVWAATEGGLSRVKDGRVTTLTSRSGLPCNAVHWVMEDNLQSFWLNMPCGLVRIARSELDAWRSDSKRSVQTTVFDSADGVRSHAFAGRYGPKVTKSPDGRIWFSPLDGVSIIDPHHLPSNKFPPPVHIEQITVDGKTYDPSHGLRVPALVRNLAIDYTALSLTAPEKVRFRFKLEGHDQDWREAVNQRRVEYSNLPPGDHRFRVIACNNSGIWNETGDTLDFSIAPAYYQTGWFWALSLAAFFLSLWGLYRYRLHQIGREFNAQVEARIEERTRIARDLHDTLLQSFQGLMLRFQTVRNLLPARPLEAMKVLDGALDHADEAIVEGREAIQNLRSSTALSNELAEAVRAVGHELSPGEGAEFRMLVEGSPRDLSPLLRDEIYRIAREAIRNAFHHAQARVIEAEIAYGPRLLRLHVRDDGKGIDPVIAQDGRSGHYGIAGMRERAAHIGAQLNIWSGKGSGTEIELNVPASIAYEASGNGALKSRFRHRSKSKPAG